MADTMEDFITLGLSMQMLPTPRETLLMHPRLLEVQPPILCYSLKLSMQDVIHILQNRIQLNLLQIPH